MCTFRTTSVSTWASGSQPADDQLAAYVQHIVASAPPFTGEQRDRIASVFGGVL